MSNNGTIQKPQPPKPQPGQFIDTDTITSKNLTRIDDWALKIMKKHEHRFSDKIPLGKIFIREELKAEDVDIPQIYDFSGLHYVIYRDYNSSWAIRIMCGNRLLVTAAYAKI